MASSAFAVAAVGFAFCFIRWGQDDGFHGRGFPIMVEAWGLSRKTGQMMDYPNPLGFVLNPLLFALVYLLIHGSIVILLKLIKVVRGGRSGAP